MIALVVLFLNSHSDQARISQRKTDCPVYGNPEWCNGPHGFCVSIKGWGSPSGEDGPSSVSPEMPSLPPPSVDFPSLQSSPRQTSYPAPSQSLAHWVCGSVGLRAVMESSEEARIQGGAEGPAQGCQLCGYQHSWGRVTGSIWPSGSAWLTRASQQPGQC